MGKPENRKNNHTGHRQRVKDRFINEGIASFEDHVALEMLLYYAIPQKDTNDLAHDLINEFGSLAGVFDASVDALMSVKGIGENTAVLIKLIPAMYSKYLFSKQNSPKIVLDSFKASGEYFSSQLLNYTHEVFMAAFLDSRLTVKKTAIISEGDVSSTEVNYAKIISTATLCHTKNIIVAHNHPSGVAAPSAADADVIRELARTLSKVNLHLCDSIVVAGTEYCSMAQHSKYKYLF